MERSLLWSAFALGCVGWACTLVLSYERQRARRARGDAPAISARSPITRVFLLTAAAILVLVFLATLPTRPPFSPGQGWGRGFLLGGISAFLAAASIVCAYPLLATSEPALAENDTAIATSMAGPYFMAVVAAALPLLVFPITTIVIDPLIGVASGWFVVSFVLYLGLYPGGVANAVSGAVDSIIHRQVAIALISGVGFVAALCATVALGIYRDPLTAGVRNGTWSALALILAAGVPFALLVGALLSQILARNARRRLFPQLLWKIVFPVVLLLGLAALLSIKVINQPRVFFVIGLGLLLGLLVWWLARDTDTAQRLNQDVNRGNSSPESSHTQSPNTQSPNTQSSNATVLAALVLLSGFMVGYQMLQGFGVGLMSLATWLAVGMASPTAFYDMRVTARADERDAASHDLPRLLLFGVVLLLYHFFIMRFRDDLRGVALTDHYALFGFLVGVLLPMLLSDLMGWSRLEADNPRRSTSSLSLSPNFQITRLVLAGTLAVIAPGIIVLLWDAKCALALMAGLALSIVAQRSRATTSWFPALGVALLALAVALILAQWTHRALPLAEMSRAQRMHALIYMVSLLVIVLLVVDYGGRLLQWGKQRRQRATVASR